MERQIRKHDVSNVYLQEIKRKYPLVFEMGIRVARYLEEQLNEVIGEKRNRFSIAASRCCLRACEPVGKIPGYYDLSTRSGIK